TTTTQTGFARALELYGPRPNDFTVLHYPLDFTPAISRVLNHLRPDLVILMELEAWPNFMLQCEKRRIPVVVVNGRMTEPSYRKYRLLGPIIRRTFRRIAAACVQEPVYAERFSALGLPSDRLSVTGTMKF